MNLQFYLCTANGKTAMISTKHVTYNFLKLLQEKFKILDSIEFKEFDHDFNVLKVFLEKNYKAEYLPEERILIEHMDTDYYFDECETGINFRNFFQVAIEFNISPSVFIIYTNHFGLQKEIELLCKSFDTEDRPLLIESFIGNNHWSNEIDNISCNFNCIEYNALCMMNEKRSHRSAFYHSLKPISNSKIALKITKKS